MAKTAIFMADGCEEIEALTVVDLLRRADITIDMLSINGSDKVTGSHGITFETDGRIEDADWDSYDSLVLPGGMPGTTNLGECEPLCEKLRAFAADGKLVAAICAAPTVLGANHILEGKKATCYPGLEEKLLGAAHTTDEVAADGNVITSRGMGTAIPFALALIEYMKDAEASKKMAEAIVFRA